MDIQLRGKAKAVDVGAGTAKGLDPVDYFSWANKDKQLAATHAVGTALLDSPAIVVAPI